MNALPSRLCLGLLTLGCVLACASPVLADPPAPTGQTGTSAANTTPAPAPAANANPAPAPGANTTTAPTPAASTTPAPAPSFLVIGASDTGFSGKRFGLILIGAAITFLLYYFLSGLHPLRLIVGVDNRYSNSQFQVALWFFVVITSYIATFALRWRHGIIGGIDIPQHLLLISGMSAFTYGAAKGITTSKVNDALAQGKATPKPAASAPSLLKDLTHNDGIPDAQPPAQVPPVDPKAPAQPPAQAAQAGQNAPAPPSAPTGLDLGDTQMVIVTLLAVATYLVNFYYFLGAQNFGSPGVLSLPDADVSILSIFGLGQGAYIVKKAVGNAGQS